jgi:coenzyme F420-reducing hydrogenase beta subunit
MRPNITELIVQQDKCIGCGVCDTICPVNVLDMQFNAIGMYEPKESDGCLDKCTLCIDVCPFVETNKTEKELAKELYGKQENISFHNDLGFYTSTHEVHKKELSDRLESASGGAGNSILNALLESKAVDAVLSVEPNEDVDKLFKFSVFKNSEELQKTRGSVYYPTELSEVLDYVTKNDGSYAITALPCFANAIRLAQEKNHKLRKRIKFIIGLVCGQMKTKEFTHTLARNAIKTDRLEYVKFRVKQENEPATNFAFEFKGKVGSVGRLSWTAQLDGPARLWGSRAFTPMACNSCTDVFAHCADIVLMDAWLPEYSRDYKGHTLVISRTKEVTNFLETLSDIELHPISAKKVLLSQQAVVDNKNAVALGTKSFFLTKTTKIRLQIQKLSLEGYEKNKVEIQALSQKIDKIHKIKGILMLPKRIVSKIYRVLKGTR